MCGLQVEAAAELHPGVVTSSCRRRQHVTGATMGSAARSGAEVCKAGTEDFCSTRRREEAGVNHSKGVCLGYWIKLVLALPGVLMQGTAIAGLLLCCFKQGGV